jgi:tetratricopeptide (TPR) repeat protein
LKKSPTPRALKCRLLQFLLPALALLALTARQGSQASRSLQSTSQDMLAEPGASSTSPLATVALSTMARSDTGSAPTSLEALTSPEVPADTLALPHEHLSRVNHLTRARTLSELGDLSGALTECRRALHDAPEDEEALRAIARLGRLTGRREFALLALERLGRLSPDDASPLIQRARLLVSQGRHADAIHVGEEAISRDPEAPEAYHVLGRAHLAAGHLSEAALRFQQAVHLAPEHGHALNNLGLAWLRANEYAKAAEALARATALLPHVAYVHNNLGVAYERLGRTEEAQAAYTLATRLSPRYVQARINADRMNKVASLGVPPPGPRDGMAPRPASQDTGL